MFALFINRRRPGFDMARGKNDLILRDRLQFTIGTGGDLPIVYGRVDLSDYVSVVNNQGLSIKEMRVQVRDPGEPNTGVFMNNLLGNRLGNDELGYANLKIIGTTTAYESGVDTGLGSPNLFFDAELQHEQFKNTGGDILYSNNDWIQFGTPDLHSEGYVVVSDVLVGICSNDALGYEDQTLELDVMLIAEPIKVSKDELKEMPAQATDL